MSTVSKAPGLAGLYVRAVLPRRRSRGPVPARTLSFRAPAPDAGQLRRYAEVCGFDPAADRLAPTYPHIVAFPLAMRLMTAGDFPFPVLGLVHLANRIDQLRRVAPAEALSYDVWIDQPRPHPKGRTFDVHATASAAGTPVWREVSTYLSRGGGGGGGGSSGEGSGEGSGGAPGGAEPPPEAPDFEAPTLDEPWPLTPATGRRYAAASGDRNPIHLHPLTARLFGFPRAIAHGMWTKAHALATLSTADLLPETFTAEVTFRAPALLPSTPRFRAARTGEGVAFELRSGEREHLRGVIAGVAD
ncbi:MaoC/PaaZ C-terminal domain-containing protein [Streptomyces sp. NPDC051940]|uniref:MaoC family dehydratase n=1 Tax=Streptomyces sp. NPDC051940 TaxID=3155675 RepID=UPI003428BA87